VNGRTALGEKERIKEGCGSANAKTEARSRERTLYPVQDYLLTAGRNAKARVRTKTETRKNIDRILTGVKRRKEKRLESKRRGGENLRGFFLEKKRKNPLNSNPDKKKIHRQSLL